MSRRAARLRASAPMGSTVSDGGLTKLDRVWLALHDEPWSSARELSDELGIPSSYVCHALQQLRFRGAVVRQRVRPPKVERACWIWRTVGETPDHLR
jgi:predicted ArsR family transcriptional regulator